MKTEQNQRETEPFFKHVPENEELEAGKTNENPMLDMEDAIKEVDNDHIQKLEQEVSLEKDKLLRLFAEFENYKKRTIRERMELMKTAGEEVIYSLLPVLDDFERAIKNVSDADNTVKEGLLLIHHKLKNILEQKGLTAIEALGKPFDTDLHDAITNVQVDEDKKGLVIEEAEKGYYLHGKVIRHAKVIVGN